jgi:hypothetical protein
MNHLNLRFHEPSPEKKTELFGYYFTFFYEREFIRQTLFINKCMKKDGSDLSNPKQVTTVRSSLLPRKFPAAKLDALRSKSKLYNRLVYKMTRDFEWIHQKLAAPIAGDPFMKT